MIGASQFLTFEYPLLFWMESRGFDVSYMSCMDLHDSSPVTPATAGESAPLDGSRRVLLRRDVQQLEERRRGVGRHPAKRLERGVSLRREPDRRARARTIDVRRQSSEPHHPSHRTLGTDRALADDGCTPNRPASPTATSPMRGELMGARLVEPAVGVADWRCLNTTGPLGSRFYSGTGLRDDDGLRGLIGHEFTGNPVGRPGLEVLAEERLFGGDGQLSRQQVRRHNLSRTQGQPGLQRVNDVVAPVLECRDSAAVSRRRERRGSLRRRPACSSGVRRTCRGSSA